jgi:hypothetical protein
MSRYAAWLRRAAQAAEPSVAFAAVELGRADPEPDEPEPDEPEPDEPEPDDPEPDEPEPDDPEPDEPEPDEPESLAAGTDADEPLRESVR